MSDLYSPPDRSYPQKLPNYWKFEDGTIRTDLQTLSDDELHALGWHGPIEMPSPESYFVYRNVWNSETLSFDYIELDEFEKRRNVNYQNFWDTLVETSFYKKIKDESKLSLEMNVLSTEFIALIGDAKQGVPRVEHIQNTLNEILSLISLTNEDYQEIQQIFINSGMFSVYTLPNI